MGELLIAFFAGFIPAAAAGALGWVKWLNELREKRREREAKDRERMAKEKVEETLRQIQRRALTEMPYFAPARAKFNGVMWHNPATGEHHWVSAGDPQLLCFIQEEVGSELKDGEEVWLLMENRGSGAQEVGASIEGQAIDYFNFEDDGVLLPAIAYKYERAKHGQLQTIEMSFLAENGWRDAHRYATKHGVRHLVRIDPK